jgi:cytochrome c-type biogenesis protein CcmH
MMHRLQFFAPLRVFVAVVERLRFGRRGDRRKGPSALIDNTASVGGAAQRKESQTRKRMFCLLVFASAMLPMGAAPVYAVTPDEMLRDPDLEARARSISRELRCVVCQNQSIDDSNAPLAHDLRVLLRERLAVGDSDQQSMDYIVARYGNFVLLKPPVQLNTLFLWVGPALFLLLATVGFSRYVRRRAADRPIEDLARFTSTEQERLNALLNRGGSQ